MHSTVTRPGTAVSAASCAASVVTAASAAARPSSAAATTSASEHTATIRPSATPPCPASACSIWLTSSSVGTVTRTLPAGVSRAAARAAMRVLPVPHALSTVARPPSRSASTTAATATG
ncbi:MAG TPA: hypothetical protein VMV07_26595 [Streptosporangiaceae bacterium]|nr:hypothetical protein [Streptosporangiaceae bacterium]